MAFFATACNVGKTLCSCTSAKSLRSTAFFLLSHFLQKDVVIKGEWADEVGGLVEAPSCFKIGYRVYLPRGGLNQCFRTVHGSAMFWIMIFETRHILNQFFITKRQISNWTFHKVSVFESTSFAPGHFHVFIKTVQVPVLFYCMVCVRLFKFLWQDSYCVSQLWST